MIRDQQEIIHQIRDVVSHADIKTRCQRCMCVCCLGRVCDELCNCFAGDCAMYVCVCVWYGKDV